MIDEINYKSRTSSGTQDYASFSKREVHSDWYKKFSKLFPITQKVKQLFVEIVDGKYNFYFNKLYFPNRKDGSRDLYQTLQGEGKCGSDSAKFIYKLIKFYLLDKNNLEAIEKLFDEKFTSNWISENYNADQDTQEKGVCEILSEIDKGLDKYLKEEQSDFKYDISLTDGKISYRKQSDEKGRENFLKLLDLLNKSDFVADNPHYFVVTDGTISKERLRESSFYKELKPLGKMSIISWSDDDEFEGFDFPFVATVSEEKIQISESKEEYKSSEIPKIQAIDSKQLQEILNQTQEEEKNTQKKTLFQWFNEQDEKTKKKILYIAILLIVLIITPILIIGFLII